MAYETNKILKKLSEWTYYTLENEDTFLQNIGYHSENAVTTLNYIIVKTQTCKGYLHFIICLQPSQTPNLLFSKYWEFFLRR